MKHYLILLAVSIPASFVCNSFAQGNYPQEKIARFQEYAIGQEPLTQAHKPWGNYTGWAVSFGNVFAFAQRTNWAGPNQEDKNREMAQFTFFVYTAPAVDRYISDTRQQLEQRLTDTEKKLRDETIVAVNAIPAKLLQDEVVKGIEARLYATLHQEIESVRKDLIDRINNTVTTQAGGH